MIGQFGLLLFVCTSVRILTLPVTFYLYFTLIMFIFGGVCTPLVYHFP